MIIFLCVEIVQKCHFLRNGCTEFGAFVLQQVLCEPQTLYLVSCVVTQPCGTNCTALQHKQIAQHVLMAMAREYLFIHLDPLEENLLPHTFLRNGCTECALQHTFCTSISQECVGPLNLVQKCLEFEGFRPFFGLRTFMSGL